jgi:hypothetical protein
MVSNRASNHARVVRDPSGTFTRARLVEVWSVKAVWFGWRGTTVDAADSYEGGGTKRRRGGGGSRRDHRRGGRDGRGGGGGGGGGAPEMVIPQWDGGDDQPPLLLFDLNGTLTSHTAARNSSGVTRLRPCIELLRRLQVRVCVLFLSNPP